MTRRMVYGFGLWLTIACTAMTVASIVMPRWVSYGPKDGRKYSLGLHSHCSSVTNTCTKFPSFQDCRNDKWSFCSMWRTVGFFVSFAVAIELCTLVAFVVIISGGVQRRAAGWKVICHLLFLGGLAQCVGMAIVAFLFDHDDRFFEGWYLDASWTLCTISWSILVLSSFGIAATALYLPAEGDYELIPNSPFEIVQDEQLNSRISSWNDGYQQDRSY